MNEKEKWVKVLPPPPPVYRRPSRLCVFTFILAVIVGWTAVVVVLPRSTNLGALGFLLSVLLAGMWLVCLIQLQNRRELTGRKHLIAAVITGLVSAPIILFQPGFTAVSERDMRYMCANNLSRIGVAIEGYVSQWQWHPTTGIPGDSHGSLMLLYPEFLDDLNTLVCPADRKALRKFLGREPDGASEESTSYFYDNLLPPSPDDSLLMVYEKVPHIYDERYLHVHILMASYTIRTWFARELPEKLAVSRNRAQSLVEELLNDEVQSVTEE